MHVNIKTAVQNFCTAVNFNYLKYLTPFSKIP